MLQLAPFPLSHLEAAIAPGPQPAHSAPPASPSGSAPAVEYDPTTIVDERYGASAVLLRDIHASLLRLAENHGPKGALAGVQPEAAKLTADDGKAENWQERTINAVLAATADISTLEARVGCTLVPGMRVELARLLVRACTAAPVRSWCTAVVDGGWWMPPNWTGRVAGWLLPYCCRRLPGSCALSST
jgi:hypothetical protein